MLSPVIAYEAFLPCVIVALVNALSCAMDSVHLLNSGALAAIFWVAGLMKITEAILTHSNLLRLSRRTLVHAEQKI